MKISINQQDFNIVDANVTILNNKTRESRISIKGSNIDDVNDALNAHGPNTPFNLTKDDGDIVEFEGYKSIKSITRSISSYDDIIRVELSL